MSSLWRCLIGKASKTKKSREKSTDGTSEPSGTSTATVARAPPPTITIEHVDYVQPQALTKEELLADLRIDFEDAEGDPDKPFATPEWKPAFRRKSSPQSRIAIPQTEEAVPYSISIPIPIASDEVINLEAGADSVKRSYLSIIPTTIQQISENTTLFVWQAYFHPAIGRRFSNVLVSIKFTPVPGSTMRQRGKNAHPFIAAYAPHKSFGATSSEQRNISWGLELPISAPAGPISIGATPSAQSETQKQVQHAFTIAGTIRGTSVRNGAVWTIEENGSTERGIPSELQLAALVQHSGPVVMETDITGRTAGGYLPSHHLRPKTDAVGRKKVIDPALFKGLLFEYEFDEKEGIVGSKKLLAAWTGKVDGAVLEFDQDVVRA